MMENPNPIRWEKTIFLLFNSKNDLTYESARSKVKE